MLNVPIAEDDFIIADMREDVLVEPANVPATNTGIHRAAPKAAHAVLAATEGPNDLHRRVVPHVVPGVLQYPERLNRYRHQAVDTCQAVCPRRSR